VGIEGRGGEPSFEVKTRIPPKIAMYPQGPVGAGGGGSVINRVDFVTVGPPRLSFSKTNGLVPPEACVAPAGISAGKVGRK